MDNEKKKDRFLLIVQTMLLADCINRATDEDALQHREKFSMTHAGIVMDDALYASERIPEEYTAYKAANEFCSFALLEEIPCPNWCVRH